MKYKLIDLQLKALEAIENGYSFWEVVEIYGEMKKIAFKEMPHISFDTFKILETAKIIAAETLYKCGFDGDIEAVLYSA